jgi:hypothetical protein
MPKTYDPACYALAEHFLRDEPCAADPATFKAHCEAMAREFQQVNEDWHFDNYAEKAA